ncbi:hypothetical protein Tco_1443189 [Tanacetum coccineum]
MSTWNINWTRSCSDIVAFACVLRMISEVMLQVLADHESILYGLRSERFGVKFCVELKCLRIVVLRLVWTPAWEFGCTCGDYLIVGHVTAAPRGGRTGRRTSRGGGRTRGRSDDQSNGGIKAAKFNSTILAQVGNQGSNQGNGWNQNGDAINDNIQGDVRNVIVNNDQRGCAYKEFLACNPKEYDGKGGAIVYTRWIEKMESV